jgi:hypothetical protein
MKKYNPISLSLLPIMWHSQMEQQQQEGEAVATTETAAATTTEAATTQTEVKTFIGEDLAFPTGWQEKLPEEMRPTAANYKDLPSLVKSLIHTKQLASGKMEGYIKVPGEGATPEEVAAYRKAQGVPDAPDAYELKKPEGELGNYYNEEEVKAFATKAAELGLTKAQAAALAEWRLGISKEHDDKEREEGRAFLAERDKVFQEAWGAKKDAEMVDAQRMLLTLDHSLDPKMVEFMEPKLVVAMAAFAKKMNPDAMVSRERFDNKLSPTSASQDIISNKANPDHEAYHNMHHPNHAAVVQKVLDGFKQS